MAEGTRLMTTMEEAISKITETQNKLISTQLSIQDDIRCLTLQPTALEGKFEHSIQNRNSDSDHTFTTSATAVPYSNQRRQFQENEEC